MTRVEYYILMSHYGPGTRVMTDKKTFSGRPANSTGRVLGIDCGMDLILVKWSDGTSSNLIYGKDMFHLYPRNLRKESKNYEQKRSNRNQKELLR